MDRWALQKAFCCAGLSLMWGCAPELRALPGVGIVLIDEDKAAVSAESLVRVIGEEHPDVVYGGDLEATYDLLTQEVQTGDVIVTMGAGNITSLAERLVKN